MPLRLKDVIKFRGDRLFNGAVNIDWYSTDEVRTKTAAEAFIFHGPQYHGVTQADVDTSHGYPLQDTASFSRSVVRRCYGIEDQPFTLAIAGYGTGKSHLGLTLASLLNNPRGAIARSVLSNIATADKEIGSDIKAILHETNQPCLVIALNGMRSFDLTAEVTKQIISDIKIRGLDSKPLDDLSPRFSQAASLIRMSNKDVVKELIGVSDAENIESVLEGLEQHDELVYSKVHGFFLSRGMPIRALGGESVRDVIDVVVREYCGIDKPYRSIVILFDEFGRYIEFATVRSQIAGSGVLQELFESIQANSGAACFIGFIQYELSAYVQRIAPEYKNEILRYTTRYQTAGRAHLSINLETLIAHLLEKRKPQDLSRWLDSKTAHQDSLRISRNLMRWFPQAQNHRLWGDSTQFHKVIREGCWPLSAYSTWFLFYLASVGKHLQERSALALLVEVFDRFKDVPVAEEGHWSLAPVDLWSESLQQELISSEEGGQQGSITHAYASVLARHGAALTDEPKRILCAIVLASKMGLQVSDQGDAIEALSELAGITVSLVKKGVNLLQEEYNVLEWDEPFKEFNILGDAVPRTQFLAFIRQRVASKYDELGKAQLFASKASEWCELLGDLECDFAEENKITTREWRYLRATSDLDLLPMHVKMAVDRWQNAVEVDEPRGTIIYCYVEPSRNPTATALDAAKLLKNKTSEAGFPALPLLILLLVDEDGALGQALAELAVLEESISEEDRVRFGNLIGSHKEKTKQLIRSHIENLIKQRHYVTFLKEEMGAHKLSRVGKELFSKIYKNPVPFPFDGFSTAKGNAADTCQELTSELLSGKLDYDAVIAKTLKTKNRAVSVLKDSWGIFTKKGDVSRRPAHPVVRSITEKWDEILTSDGQRFLVGEAIRLLCLPPYGANIASAGLLLAVFVAPRVEKLVVVRDGKQYALSQLLQEGVFRGKFIDYLSLRDLELVLLGEESSEWESLLDEWELAESHLVKIECLKRAKALRERMPVPPSQQYRVSHFEDQAKISLEAFMLMEKAEDEGVTKIESGYERNDISSVIWGAAKLQSLIDRMSEEKPLWTDHQIEKHSPRVERARQVIIQGFTDWTSRQAPRNEFPDTVGEFKHKMLHMIGGDLKKLGLQQLFQELEIRVSHIIRNSETVAAAQQLVRDVRSWLQFNSDVFRISRISENRGLREVGKEYGAKLKGISDRISAAEIGEVRVFLADFLAKLKNEETKQTKRVSSLWQTKLQSEEDIERIIEETEALNNVFENCQADLGDLQQMRRALRVYKNDFRQLGDKRLTWQEFDALTKKLQGEAENALGKEETPWPPDETINDFVAIIIKQRKEASSAWIDALESDARAIASLSVGDANQLHVRANNPPAVITEPHSKRQKKVLKDIEVRLDTYKVEWLMEKFKELAAPLRKKFLDLVAKEGNK